jgi:hypothetical protein
MAKFAIFSTEMGPSLDPVNMSTPPEDVVVFDRDPIATGEYDPHVGTTTRGIVIPTLGGVVVQDFGEQIMDQRIRISDDAAMSKSIAESLYALYIVASTEYYFTDGYDCFLMQFARPNGFTYRRNLISSFYNVPMFDYEINLVVKAIENV